MDAAQQSAHIIPLVRKLRDAGVPPSAAEAVGETMAQFVTKAELQEALDALEKRLKENIKLAIADAMLKMVLAMIAVQGLGVAVIVLLLK